MTWKNKGSYRPYPSWALRGPWVEKKCASCGIKTGGAVPKAFHQQSMCFACPALPDEIKGREHLTSIKNPIIKE